MDFPTAKVLLEGLVKSKHGTVISASSHSLDCVLGGGIEVGHITEVAGESGLGKTQLCFQLCVNVQLPTQLGGLDGEAVFIDTENTFSSARLIEIGQASSKHYKEKWPHIANKGEFLSRVYVFRCIHAVELLAVCHQLKEFLTIHSKVRLVVIDSVASSIRSEQVTTRTKLIWNIASRLRELVTIHPHLAVVVVNQVTTRFNNSDQTSSIIPSLGRTWSYVPSVKLMLTRAGSNAAAGVGRLATLRKSPTHPPGSAAYTICKDGFRDEGYTNSSYDVTHTSLPPRHQTISKHFLHLSQKVLEANDDDVVLAAASDHWDDDQLQLTPGNPGGMTSQPSGVQCGMTSQQSVVRCGMTSQQSDIPCGVTSQQSDIRCGVKRKYDWSECGDAKVLVNSSNFLLKKYKNR